MPQDNPQLVRNFYDSLARRDPEGMRAVLDPSVVWTSAENFLYSDMSPYVGVEAVLHLLFVRLLGDWDNLDVSAGEIQSGGDLVIASGRFRGTFKTTRLFIDAEFAQVFYCNNGKITKCQAHTDTAQFKAFISGKLSTEV